MPLVFSPGEPVSAFDEAWLFLKAFTHPEDENKWMEGVGWTQSVPFDELLNSFAESHPYFNHPENETYKELMQYQQAIENQKTPLSRDQDEDRRFLARLALEEGDHLHDLQLEEGR